jgi:hypothetical protein
MAVSKAVCALQQELGRRHINKETRLLFKRETGGIHFHTVLSAPASVEAW